MHSDLNRGSTNEWYIVYLGLPLIPIWIGALVRFVTSMNFSITTFSASDTAICLALLSIFISQNLVRNEMILPSKEKIDEIQSQSNAFLIIAVFFLTLFILNVVFDTLSQKGSTDIGDSLLLSRITVFIFTPFALRYSYTIQKAYKLKANIF